MCQNSRPDMFETVSLLTYRGGFKTWRIRHLGLLGHWQLSPRSSWLPADGRSWQFRPLGLDTFPEAHNFSNSQLIPIILNLKNMYVR